MTLENQRLNSAPKWVNPCGLAHDRVDFDASVAKLSDNQLLSQIVLLAKNVLSHTKLFRNDYVEQVFGAGFDDFNDSWKDRRYDWLPSVDQIPKNLGDHLSQDFLDRMDLNTVLLDSYEYLQKFAVGLEQIVWDQEDQRLGFRRFFADEEFQLRALLCEIQVALLEKGIVLRPDVGRDAMPAEHRSMSVSKTDIHLRDWLIFRDYMNCLEFVIQAFEHLLTKTNRAEEL